MIIVGIVLLILGLVLAVPILWTIGIILVLVGAVLWILGATGGPSAAATTTGDPHYSPHPRGHRRTLCVNALRRTP